MTALQSFETSPEPSVPVLELLPNDETTQKFHGHVQVAGSKETIDWTLEVPLENLSYEGLVMELPGLGCIKRHSRAERHANARAGEATISYAPARVSGNTKEDIFASHKLHAKSADAVLTDVQKRLKNDSEIPGRRLIDPHRVTLSPHSMGGYPATTIGLWRASEIEAVIYKAAAGFGTPSWRALQQLKLGHTLVEIADYIGSDESKLSTPDMWKSGRYFSRNIPRTLGEVATCLTRDISEDIAALHDEGVKLAYMGFAEDGLVPVKSVRPVAEPLVDSFIVLAGFGHLAPQRYPEMTASVGRSLRHMITT